MSTISRTRKAGGKGSDWYLVKYLEDGAIYACPQTRIRSDDSGSILARWPVDGKWYNAAILQVGDKCSMQEKAKGFKYGAAPDTNSEVLTTHTNIGKDNQSYIVGAASQDSKSHQSNQKEPTLDTVLNQPNQDKTEEDLNESDETKKVLFSLDQMPLIDGIYKRFPNTCSEFLTGNTQMGKDNQNLIVDSGLPDQGKLQKTIQNDPIHVKANKNQAAIQGQRENYLNIGDETEEVLCNLDQMPLVDAILLRSRKSQSYKPFFSEDNPFSSDDPDFLKYSTEGSSSSIELENISYDCGIQNCSNEMDVHNKSTFHCDNSSITQTTIDVEIKTGQDNAELWVDTVKTNNKKRCWDKRFFCVFCKKLVAKLPRHLEQKHSDELEVSKFLALPTKDKERFRIITQLRNRGYFQYNTQVIKNRTGKIIPKKRDKQPSSPSKFLPCQYCGAFYSKKHLSRHTTVCSENTTGESYRNRCIQSSSVLMLPTTMQLSQKFKECILQRMTCDDTFRSVISDSTIISFGEHLFDRLGHHQRHHRMIIDKCRELGRLLIKSKAIDNTVKEISDLFTPKKYQTFKKAVQLLAGFDVVKNVFKIPSLAVKVGQSIKKCAFIFKGICLEDDIMVNRQKEINDFIEILSLKWKDDITAKALRTLEENKWNKSTRLPVARDITKLNKYLMEMGDSYQDTLSTNATPINFSKLTEVVLCRTIILNRRRVGEVQYMTKDAYTHCNPAELSDVQDCLSETERILTLSLKRVEIRGKKGRMVPVIMTKNLQDSLELLLKMREKCGVPDENPYLFPSLTNSSGYYRADKLLRKYANLCGADHPDNLTSTRLRKHVATMTQLLNLREHELDAVANYMGHDIRVHRQFYRLPADAMQLAKVSKLLLAMERGKISKFKNKNLDEIEVGEEELTDDNEVCEDEIEEPMLLENTMSEQTLTGTSPKSTVTSSTSTQSYISKNLTNSKKCPNTTKNTFTTSKQSEKLRKKVIRKPWSSTEMNELRNYFKGFLILKEIPKKVDCQNFLLLKGNVMNERNWRDIKYAIYNILKKNKK